MYIIFRAFALLEVVLADKAELRMGTARLFRREGHSQSLATNSVRFTKLLQTNRSRWIVGKRGESCDETCSQAKEGLKCSSEKQREVNTSNMFEIALALGTKCKVVQTTGYPAAPSMRGEICVSSTGSSNCTARTRKRDFRRLCFCQALEWSLVHPTKACEDYFFQNRQKQIKALSGVDLDECKRQCEDLPKCKTVDFFAATELCTLYEASCDKTKASSDHDEGSSWNLSRG
eukprot:TRINITY_DN19968_c0_g1_i3.p1 TRINITY_DN19968_c0_g1~~TRINITY_DN19968_c0_g1_i3.p1  ORF type:complete len:232 (-),score=24.51 TRINITY_DN19968_c0_g1_i3:211-906(-)